MREEESDRVVHRGNAVEQALPRLHFRLAHLLGAHQRRTLCTHTHRNLNTLPSPISKQGKAQHGPCKIHTLYNIERDCPPAVMATSPFVALQTCKGDEEGDDEEAHGLQPLPSCKLLKFLGGAT